MRERSVPDKVSMGREKERERVWKIGGYLCPFVSAVVT